MSQRFPRCGVTVALMAIYTAILPNGQPYQLRGPEGASAEDIQAAGAATLCSNIIRAPYVDYWPNVITH